MNQTTTPNSIPSQKEFTGPRFLIGVRIGNAPKSELYDPGKLDIRVGIQVMVETEQGIQMGIIASNKIPNIKKKEDRKSIRFTLEPSSRIHRSNKYKKT